MSTFQLRRVGIIVLMLVGSTQVYAPAPSWAGPADQMDSNLIVQFTSPAAGGRLNGGVSIQGFVGDRRSTSGSGITEKTSRFTSTPHRGRWIRGASSLSRGPTATGS